MEISIVIGIIGVVVLLILMICGMHIAFALGLAGLAGIIVFRGWEVGLNSAGYSPFTWLNNYQLAVLPLFMLMGYLAFYAGIADDVFETAKKWFGSFSGGLPVATALGNAAFAASSGAGGAAAAVFTKVSLPPMEAAGIDRTLAVGTIAASGTLAALIPPSGLIVIYGLFAEQSIGKLLIAGVIPGIISALIYSGGIFARCSINPKLAPRQPSYSWKQRLYSLKYTWTVLVIFILILGGIYTGIFTPTEAGGIGAAGIFLIALSMRRLSLSNIRTASMETGSMMIMIFALFIGAKFFLCFMGLSGITASLTTWVLSLQVSRYIILAGFLMIYIFLGMFIGSMAMIMLTVPIMLPAIISLGFNPIWFGIIVIKMCEIASISPPGAINVFIVHNVRPDIPIGEIFRGIGPFLVMDILTVALFIVFPQIVTFLPEMM